MKIFFINTQTGYVSIQSFKDSIEKVSYSQTTNSGRNWELKQFPVQPGKYEAMAIGFLNEEIGVLGGIRILDDGNVLGESYITKNSGQSWEITYNYINLNRIRKIDENIYSSGKYFYKILIR